MCTPLILNCKAPLKKSNSLVIICTHNFKLVRQTRAGNSKCHKKRPVVSVFEEHHRRERKCFPFYLFLCFEITNSGSKSYPFHSFLLQTDTRRSTCTRILILVAILIWRPAHSHTYSCPVVGLPITISQCQAGNTRGGVGTLQKLIREI